MTSDEKKAFLLLKSVIFHYHGLDEDEQQLLTRAAQNLDAEEELAWANEFIAKDYYDAFDRARGYLRNIMLSLEKEKRLKHLTDVWKANLEKGYISEMEAMGMIKLAKDWGVEKELVASIRQ
ncbi:MAG: hypothetical protein ACFCUI_12990 [Bernardetiaceae bacterium]